MSYFSPVLFCTPLPRALRRPSSEVRRVRESGDEKSEKGKKKEETENNLNSNILSLPPYLINMSPVQRRNLTEKMKKHLKQPETCSNPGRSSKAGFTFLRFMVS